MKQALAFALRYRGRKRVDLASERMAQIAAEHLVEHLRMSGFVIMHKQPAYSGDCDRLIRPMAITQSGDRDHLRMAAVSRCC